MQIQDNTVVSMTYVLRDENRMIVDASVGGPFNLLIGHHNIIPGLEKALMGLGEGERKSVTVAPEDGYGMYNPDMRMSLPKAQFGEDLPQVGRQVQLNTPEGPIVATIMGEEGDNVLLDANHPLAGKTLYFEVDILALREASAEELSHGHPHDPNNPHHH